MEIKLETVGGGIEGEVIATWLVAGCSRARRRGGGCMEKNIKYK